ncbi:MAG: hypothetical protein JWL69_2051 [Phycisphaerales bacterium]|nr:hypothetical protein [Phycisphaerales bacterium]
MPAEVAQELGKTNKPGYIVLTRKGKPVAYVVPTEFYDEEDIGYMTDPDFWKMIRERRESDEGVPLEVIEAEVAEREKAEKMRRAKSTKTRK